MGYDNQEGKKIISYQNTRIEILQVYREKNPAIY